jgi:hypothetical protein
MTPAEGAPKSARNGMDTTQGKTSKYRKIEIVVIPGLEMTSTAPADAFDERDSGLGGSKTGNGDPPLVLREGVTNNSSLGMSSKYSESP